MSSMMKSYQLSKVDLKKNERRITNEIKKIPHILSLSFDRNKDNLHIVYDEESLDENVLSEIEDSILKAIHFYDKKAEMQRVENKEVFRKVIYLKGLDCAHCASRIEGLAKKNFDYEKIVVDFATFRFIIETTDKELIDNLEERVKQIAHRVDSRIVVMNAEVKKRQYTEEVQKINVPRTIILILGALIGVVGILFEVDFDLREILHLIGHTDNGVDNILAYFSSTPISASLLLLSYLLIGYRVIIQFFKNLFRGHLFDENFLMTIASIGAIFTVHFVEAIMVMSLFQIGEYLQNRAVNHSRKSISELLSIDVKYAKVKINSEITEIEVESVLPGDIIVVNKGEMIPLDGLVVEGKAVLDTKNITGESKLREFKLKEEVMAGSINMGNVIELKVIRPYSESMITKILDLVENASSTKAKSENFITKFSKYYTPVVIIIAFLIASLGFTITYFITRTGYGTFNYQLATSYIYRAMVFLVISCPCALVISIPLCFFGGIGLASKRGILIKGSNYLEALTNVENFVFDKTGTLTKGEFGINKVVLANSNINEEELIRMVVYTEYYSTHPIGISVVDKYGRDKIFPEIISDFQDVPSRGASATVNGSRISIGNRRLMDSMKIDYIKQDENGLVLHVVKDKVYYGYVVIGDVIREEAANTVINLRKKGVNKFCILTGDSKGIAEHVANVIGMDDVYSELLPNEKVDKLHEIKAASVKKGGRTVFVGDGINDAPVISASDVGIAMGSTGSDATIAIADIVIMSDDLDKLDEVVYIAKNTRKKVVQNIVFSLGVKFIVMILAMFLEELPLTLAILSDVGVSLIAILNSLFITGMFKKKDRNNLQSKQLIEESNG